MSQTRYYPVFLNLSGRLCVVVGGGLIAQRKAASLLSCKAKVTVISPLATARIRRWGASGRLRYLARSFRPGDLSGAWLACAATSDQSANEAVFAAAQQRRVFANIVDQSALCSFIAPSVFSRGSVSVAISTGGRSPALAKKLRKELRAAVGPEYARMLGLIRRLRPVARRLLPNYQARKRYFDTLLEGEVFDLVRAGRSKQAQRKAQGLLERAIHNGASRAV
jgi:siroheme synthase-like protein